MAFVAGEMSKAPRTQGVRGAGAFGEDAATVSCRSNRHAADLSLTGKDGKQESEKDDDENEIERHV